jgi:Mitochondrial carrier protein
MAGDAAVLPRARLTVWNSGVIGVAAGVAEVLVQHPTVAWKNALQQGRALPRTPVELYRGVGANAIANGSVTAIQFAVFAALDGTLDPVSAGLTAGAVGAVVASPFEMIMIRQQADKVSMSNAVKRCLHHPFRGYGMMACRDATFTAGYKGLAPSVTKWMSGQATYEDASSRERVLGSLMAGVVVGVISHPFDTIKTIVQGSPKRVSSLEAFQTLMSTGGLAELYRGAGPRGLRIIGAIVISRECQRILEPRFLGR